MFRSFRAMRWWGAAALVIVASLSSVSLQNSPGVGTRVDQPALLAARGEEWLTYGHDYAETHHSPLKQIDAANVSRLGLAWSTEVGSQGQVETTPLISKGIIYGTSTWSKVFAINARTGDTRWEWDPGLVRGGARAGGPSTCCGPINRGAALYQDKVYAGLLDGRLVALNADNGKLVWAVQTTPPGQDYSITGAPRVVKGKVIIGSGGAEFGVRGYVTAYDAETGAERAAGR